MTRTWKRLGLDVGLAALAAFLTVGVTLPAAAQKDPAKDAAKDAKDATKDATKDAAKDTRDAAKDTRDAARDATKDARDAVKDAKDPRSTPRDTNPPAARDPRDSRDARDARDNDRPRVGDAPRDRDNDRTRDRDNDGDRDRVRDRDRDNDGVRNRRDRDDRRDFNINTYRSADMGLWFTSTNNQLVISDIGTTGPIARLGFREDDRIVSVNGQRVTSEREFIRYLYAEDVRTTRVKVIVLRDGREEVIIVEPTVFIEYSSAPTSDSLEEFGIILDDRVTDQLIVWRVIPRTPAYYAGIRKGDVITVFDGRDVTGVSQLVSLVEASHRDTVAVKVLRDQKPRTLDVQFTSHARDDGDRRDNDRRDPEPERRSALKPATEDVPPTPAPTPAPAVKPVAPVVPTPAAPQPKQPERPRGGLLPRNR